MRPASLIGLGFTALGAIWIGLPSVDGQFAGQPAQGPKKGQLIVAADKEYEMLSQYFEMKGTFRGFNPDSGLIKIRVEYDHTVKESKDEYQRAEKAYREEMGRLTQRFNELQKQRSQYTTDKTRIVDLNRQAEQLGGEKRTADTRFHEATKNLQKVRDQIDYELLVVKDAPIRKMWSPKLFDDKGKPRDMTKEERLKYKGADPKLAGWVAKLENFEMDTPVSVTLKASGTAKAAEPTPAGAPTTPPDPNAPETRREVKIEDRPLVTLVVAQSDPTATAKKK